MISCLISCLPKRICQQKWMKNNDIAKEELDIRRNSMEQPKEDLSEITNQLVEKGNQLSSLSSELDYIINELVVTRINPKFSPIMRQNL